MHDEIVALKLMLSELQVQVAANTSALGARSASHVEHPTVSATKVNGCAKKDVQFKLHKQVPFKFPKRTVNARPSRSVTPPPIALSNRYDILRNEAVESEEQSDSDIADNAPQVITIREQLKSYASKQKTNFVNRGTARRGACLTPLSTESLDTSISSDKSIVAMPVSEQLQLYARNHSNNFANRVTIPVSQQPRLNAREHVNNTASPSATPPDSCVNPVTRRVVCVSDSMTRSIRNNFINQKLKQHSVEGSVHEIVHMDLNPGGDTGKIRHSSKLMLERHKPNTLIIVAGANDISYDTKTGTADADVIAERIINIGKEAVRDFKCVERIAISSIIIRGAAQYADIVFDVNLRLRLKCIQEDFTYIDNECITKQDLYDGLHLNKFGNDKLLHKLLSCCESYNPCLTDDLHY